MNLPEIDLSRIGPTSAETLLTLPLTAAFMVRDRELAFVVNLIFGDAPWKIFAVEGYDHAEWLASGKLQLHVFMTHWRIGEDHSWDNKVSQLVRSLKERRGEPGIGKGPLLVATHVEHLNLS